MNKKNENMLRKVSSDIGYAVLTYHKGDYDKTYKSLDSFGITNIKTNVKRKKIIIDITLNRASLFIGKEGEHINFIKDYLINNNYGKEIIINLKETAMWKYYLYPMSMDDIVEIGERI